MMIGDAMTPFDPPGGPVWPRFTVDVNIFDANFDLTIVFFDITRLQIFDVNFVSNLQFSIFPYSILIAFPLRHDYPFFILRY